MTITDRQPVMHTQDEVLRDLEFEVPKKMVKGLSDAALFDILYESLGEEREGAEVIPASE